jgi:membrane-associated phospholipid phosphatase
MKRPWPGTLGVANFFSILGHPFVLLPLTITLSLIGHLRPGKLIAVVAIFSASIILPLLVLIRRKVVSGEWTDMDVSHHDQRGRLYSVALPIIALSIPIFWLLRLPRGLIIGTVVSLFLLIAGMAINRSSKLSMHAMFGAYCMMVLWAVSHTFGLAALALLIAVGWSRVLLGRHTVAQVISGMSLGMAAGVILLWLVAT